MKKILLLCGMLCVLMTSSGFGQYSGNQQKAILLRRVIELYHCSPRAVDDSFSATLFYTLLDATDPRRLVFTAPEFKQLSAYTYSLDDELRGKSWGFLDLFSSIYQKALLRADSILGKAGQKPQDFSINESLGSSRQKQYLFAADATALAARWSKYLKLLVLGQVYNTVQQDSTGKTVFQQALQKKAAPIMEKVKQAELRHLKKMNEHPAGFEKLLFEMYLNAIATTFDPHSNYFSPEGKANFQSALSTEGYSLGLQLDENEKREIIISRLVPGGPAWKSGELHKGDIVLQLQWDNNTVLDMQEADLEDAYEMMDQQGADNRFNIRVRKANGTIRDISLRKAKMDNEENIVKGFILNGEKKIGYILLPGFYTEWENETGSSCANDVAKEIVRLKAEKIDGLILDVRFNGGGSVEEALQMTGIFINEGPLAAQKIKPAKLQFLKDPNRGTIYDGPLVLLVNGQSASASELLAASLQDYNRALIIGSNTFGKATMQQLFALDTLRRTSTMQANQDLAKITTGKLYRLNGRSAQLSGVATDISLPDGFQGVEFGERFETNALLADTASPNSYYKPLPALPIKELAERSTARIGQHPAFQQIEKINTSREKILSAPTRIIPLKWDLFEQWMKQQQEEMKIVEGNTGTNGSRYKIDNHAADKLLLQANADAAEVNRTWRQNLAADIYIEEAFSIITDLINLQRATKN